MQERAFWLAWSQVAGIGPILIRRLSEHFGTLEQAWEAKPNDLLAVEGFGLQTAETVAIARQQIDPEKLLRQHQQANPNFWTPADADYPRLLLEIPDPPPVLYYQGEVVALENQGKIPAIAIVGTREPSDYGRRWTRKLSAALSQAGFLVVSGLADGIDTEAHTSCLNAGGRTLAVMATGVDVIYPAFNRTLAKRITQQGLLLSEYPAGTQPDRVNFPRRNRIIAGLCRATLVLEAPHKSGALITARLANEYCRDVYVLPGTLDNPRCRGCLDLLYQGAQAILGEAHLLELLDSLPHLQQDAPAQQLSLLSPAPEPISLPPELQQVFQAVDLDPIALDLIVQQTQLATGTVLGALAQLELMGLVSQLSGGTRYQRS
ncbi:MAG TPA: DNA-processing protein DprA [Coleofasciculaceae cyanobacterium]